MMNATLVYTVLSLAPLAALAVAFVASLLLAALIGRKASAAYVPEASAADTAAWIESFDSLDTDAEWCETIAAAHSLADKREAFLSSAREGIKAAAARIARMHVATRTTASAASPLPRVKLASDNRKLTSRESFLTSARFGIAAASARRTIEASIVAGIDREWCEAYAAGFDHDPGFVRFEALGTLATLATRNDDTSESALVWRAMMRDFDDSEASPEVRAA